MILKQPVLPTAAAARAGLPIALCSDGYVRLRLPTLLALPLAHLLSDLDDTAEGVRGEAAVHSAIGGYTEWIGAGPPAITLGWDWRLDGREGQPCCVRTGPPRSNVMLCDRHGADLGAGLTERLLAALVDVRPWQDTVTAAIAARYATRGA